MIKELLSKITNKKNKNHIISYALVLIVYVVVEIFLKTGGISNVIKSLLIPTCAYIVAALSLNLIVGYLGDLCLGQAGFMSVGAFFGAIAAGFMSHYVDNNIIVIIFAFVVGGLFAGLCGLIIGIPVLKLQGDYLAIVTLAFCQIIKTLLLNIYAGVDSRGLHFSFLENKIELESDGVMIIKGALGANVENKLSTFTIGVILILVTLFIIYNLMDSKHGRAILSCRDNKIATTSLGISTSRYRLLAFVISAVLAGMAGVLYGLSFTSFKATKFDFNLSIMILVYVVLGGLGNMTGTIISTALLLVLPEALRSFNDYRMIIYSIVLILVMLISNNKIMMSYLNVFKERFKTMFVKKGAK